MRNAQTFNVIGISSDDYVTIFNRTTALRDWTISTDDGSFTITSTTTETANVIFYCRNIYVDGGVILN